MLAGKTTHAVFAIVISVWGATPAFAEATKEPPAEPLAPTIGPYLQFVSQSRANVFWETDRPCGSVVEYGQSKLLSRRVEDPSPKKNHKLALSGLEPGKAYYYRIRATAESGGRAGEIHRFDTALNYSLPDFPSRPSPYGDSAKGRQYAKAAEQIFRHTGITKGYCLVLGCDQGQLAYELSKRSDLRITCVDSDKARLMKIGRHFMKAGIYGSRVSVRHVASLGELPFTKCFANLIVSERMVGGGECPGSAAGMFRVLRPSGGVAYLGRPGGGNDRVGRAELEQWLQAGAADYTIRDDDSGLWAKVVRGPLPGAGRWTHQYGDPDNAANSRDSLEGATETGQLEVQWWGRPGADFGADRNPRTPAPLAAAGRLFHQGLDRIAAIDSYNGAILWSLEIPGVLRVNMPRDAGPWCADDDYLYVAMKDKCWRLDAQTGNRSATYGVTEESGGEKKPDWGYIATVGDKLYGSAEKQGAAYTNIWGGSAEGWYDGQSGAGTAKVCSDSLFAMQKQTGKRIWAYRRGAIINATIIIGGGRVCFVECRDPKVLSHPSGRIGLEELWNDQYLVALDADDGRKLWEQAIDTADGIVVFFLSYGDEKLFIMSSAAGKYHLYAYDAKDGTALWNASHDWTRDNHSGHMQHPVVLGKTIYQEPYGYDVEDGEQVTDKMARHEGCTTYVGTTGALIHRGKGRQIAIWDVTTGKTTVWNSLRPSCWLSTVAGGGMVLSPEGGGGCSCAHWLQTSLGFAKKD